eukprot:942971-Rhodomonas_salina.1
MPWKLSAEASEFVPLQVGAAESSSERTGAAEWRLEIQERRVYDHGAAETEVEKFVEKILDQDGASSLYAMATMDAESDPQHIEAQCARTVAAAAGFSPKH